MKKILLLSDTHGYIDNQILKFVKQADEVWHAGDIGNLKVTDTIKKLNLYVPYLVILMIMMLDQNFL